MTNHLIYWFPAKRYGWGWGLPSVWQGWVVMGIFAVLLLVAPSCCCPRTARWSSSYMRCACAQVWSPCAGSRANLPHGVGAPSEGAV